MLENEQTLFYYAVNSYVLCMFFNSLMTCLSLYSSSIRNKADKMRYLLLKLVILKEVEFMLELEDTDALQVKGPIMFVSTMVKSIGREKPLEEKRVLHWLVMPSTTTPVTLTDATGPVMFPADI